MFQYNFCTHEVLHTYKIKITVELGYDVTKVNILFCYKRVLSKPKRMVNSEELIGSIEYLTL